MSLELAIHAKRGKAGQALRRSFISNLSSLDDSLLVLVVVLVVVVAVLLLVVIVGAKM